MTLDLAHAAGEQYPYDLDGIPNYANNDGLFEYANPLALSFSSH